MEDRNEAREEMEKSLSSCESRLEELKGKAKSGEIVKGLDDIEAELKACRLELDQLEGKSDDDWLEAKHGLIRRLDDVQKNLQLSPRRLDDTVR
jgi:hypothetical protein